MRRSILDIFIMVQRYEPDKTKKTGKSPYFMGVRNPLVHYLPCSAGIE
jgi:hypothetical protein